MASRKFICRERSYVNNRIVEEGEIIEFDGEPSPNLELYADTPEGKAAKQEKTKE